MMTVGLHSLGYSLQDWCDSQSEISIFCRLLMHQIILCMVHLTFSSCNATVAMVCFLAAYSTSNQETP